MHQLTPEKLEAGELPGTASETPLPTSGIHSPMLGLDPSSAVLAIDLTEQDCNLKFTLMAESPKDPGTNMGNMSSPQILI